MTLAFEFSQKLANSEVRDLFAPQAFHALKVQVFNEQKIKLSDTVLLPCFQWRSVG